MDLFAQRMDREHPAWKGWSRSLVTPLQRQAAGDTRRPLLLLLAAVAAVLLIACFNVAGLLLTRSITRQREFTLRTALGAGAARMFRQVLTEGLLLAVAGGLLGIVIATAGVAFVHAFGPRNLPRLEEAAPDFRTFAFVSLVTLLSGILFALGATRASSESPHCFWRPLESTESLHMHAASGPAKSASGSRLARRVAPSLA